eukprot:TRINITY_DN76290_c0_g1_i1.p1 TRINITY_DN76290_c0_g1~~TRINITY_DN76290_c0_g1_i1.p1  ORF type:complete len:176 (-),score=23.23 TRINITY_DN76290_c0_g1_i1:337-792(-)
MDGMDFALRVCESVAFSLHSILGITEPLHGGLVYTLQGEGSLPAWFWPLAGACLAIVAFLNFSDTPEVVLGAQAYIVAFHSGAVFWHWRLRHHPAAGLAPGVFVFLAAAVTALRAGLWISLLGTLVCASAGVLLGFIMVTPPPPKETTHAE